MSRFVVGECVYEDLDDLVETMESLFGEGTVERSVSGNNELVPYGYHNDSREAEIGKVAATVRRNHISSASNDLPIIRQADGTYRVAVSDYDVSAVPRRLGWEGVKGIDDLLNRIKQVFSVQRMEKGLKKLGYSLEKETTEDGTVHIKANKYVAT